MWQLPQLGHNRRRCTGQTASSGRRERAHDWLEDIQSRGEDSEEEENRSQESENEPILDKEGKLVGENSKSNSYQFDTIQVDLGDEEEIRITYTLA